MCGFVDVCVFVHESEYTQCLIRLFRAENSLADVRSEALMFILINSRVGAERPRVVYGSTVAHNVLQLYGMWYYCYDKQPIVTLAMVEVPDPRKQKKQRKRCSKRALSRDTCSLPLCPVHPRQFPKRLIKIVLTTSQKTFKAVLLVVPISSQDLCGFPRIHKGG